MNTQFIKWRFYNIAIFALLGLAASSLTAHSTVCAPPENVVLVDNRGKSLYPSGTNARTEEAIDAHLTVITNAIASSTDCIGSDGTKRILIYVHGGLNSYDQSLTRAKEVIPQILAAHYYPLLISWDSGFKSSYCESLFLIRQGEVQRVWGPITSPFYLAADLGRALTRAPIVWYYQMANDVSTMARYETPNFTSEAKSNVLAKTDVYQNGIKISIGGDTRGWNSKLGYFVAYVLTTPFKLVTAPLIDALGKSAWDNMERRTQTMFRAPSEFYQPKRADEIRIAKTRLGEPPQGAVAELMQAVELLIKNDSTHHYSITLIGHSMGTIVANEIISTHPDLPYSNIVYMAAACNVSEFRNSVIPYLEKNPGAHFYNLTLHPVADAREAQWTYLDMTPRGSLLVWIDNFLSNPRTVPERTLGRWDNFVSATALIPKKVSHQIRVKAFAVGNISKLANNPEVHGDFSAEPFWTESFWNQPAP